MNQLEFYKKLLEIKNRYITDDDFGAEDAHMSIDALMEETLVMLGYGEGIEIIKGINLWYS